MTEHQKTTAAEKGHPKLWVRLAVAVSMVVTAWHILASFLWIAPYSENARSIIPGGQKTLASYMLPLFGQSWSVFAPEPINGDYKFDVRALLSDGTETNWVSATDVEISMIRYNLFPPRAGIQATEVASSYKKAFDSLHENQQEIVQNNFSIKEIEIGLRSDSVAPEKKANEFIQKERRALAYATQVAFAVWGEEITKVQFRVSRQNIIPFAERHNPNAIRPEPKVVSPGWRNPFVEKYQSSKNFQKVFLKQYERNSP